jgi:hypothetical protein
MMEVWNQGEPVRAGGRRKKNVPTMMEVVGPGQTCRWRLKEVEEDADARRDVGRMIP